MNFTTSELTFKNVVTKTQKHITHIVHKTSISCNKILCLYHIENGRQNMMMTSIKSINIYKSFVKAFRLHDNKAICAWWCKHSVVYVSLCALGTLRSKILSQKGQQRYTSYIGTYRFYIKDLFFNLYGFCLHQTSPLSKPQSLLIIISFLLCGYQKVDYAIHNFHHYI